MESAGLATQDRNQTRTEEAYDSLSAHQGELQDLCSMLLDRLSLVLKPHPTAEDNSAKVSEMEKSIDTSSLVNKLNAATQRTIRAKRIVTEILDNLEV